jgi:hypothetical protein
MACLRLFTVLPVLPLLSVPCLRSCITFLTLAAAASLYCRAIDLSPELIVKSALGGRNRVPLSRLTLPAPSPVYVSSSKARIACRKLHIDGGQLGRLTGTAEHVGAAKMSVFLHRRTAADL